MSLDSSKRCFDRDLIKLVKNSDCIYNKLSREYRDLELRKLTWQHIGKELKLPAETVKQRWRSIRDRYYKTKKCPVSKYKKKEIRYKYAAELSFLDKFLFTRISRSYKSDASSDDEGEYNTMRDGEEINIVEGFDPFKEDPDNVSSPYLHINEDTNKEVGQQHRSSFKEIPDEVTIPYVHNNEDDTNEEVRQQHTTVYAPEQLFYEFIDNFKELLHYVNAVNKSKTKESVFGALLAAELEEVKLPSDRFLSLQTKIFKLLQDEVRDYRNSRRN